MRRDSTTTTTADLLAPGLTYECRQDNRGPWTIHVARIDLKAASVRVEAERATGQFLGRETVSALVARVQQAGDAVLVAMNGDFFDLTTGEIENNHVVRGEWVKGALFTDSPHDEFDNAHTQFAVDARGRPLIGRFALQGRATMRGASLPLVGINYRPPRAHGLVLYTPRFGTHTPRGTELAPALDSGRAAVVLRADSARRLSLAAARQALEVAVRHDGQRADTTFYRVIRRVTVGGGTRIPAAGAVMSATGDARETLATLGRLGGVVRVVRRLSPTDVAPRTVVGGWPRLLAGGENVAANADSLEGTFPRFSAQRHPRSAVGFTRDSTTLLFVVVDGRREWSVGMSLSEFAETLAALGAYEAINLDGGGSSTLWVRGHVVNYPSDPTGERPVGNALLVRQTQASVRSARRSTTAKR